MWFARRRPAPVSTERAAIEAVDLLYRERVIRGAEAHEFLLRIAGLPWARPAEK